MNQFIFESYNFDISEKILNLNYSIDNTYNFTETYIFNFDFVIGYDPIALERAIQNLFFMAGVSYFKTYLPKEIVIKAGKLDAPSAQFFAKTWQKGLGELFYLNQLDPNTPINLPTNIDQRPTITVSSDGLLVGLGGGKDSLVSVELLRDQPKVSTWSMGHRSQLEPLVERVGLPHYFVERVWDKQLLELNQSGVYNGHVPISAILACAGTVVAILSGNRDVVVSNEASADESTLTYHGQQINHQYSKSSEFEKDYQDQLLRDFGETERYYSFLRPLSELRISEIFAQVGLNKYEDVFSSCNRAFTHLQTELSWCGNCPKCAFVFLALAPFVRRVQLEAIFGGKNLLLEPSLEPVYNQLLGIGGNKPLDCVGEIKESRTAMRIIQEHLPELARYKFDIPEDYDFREVKDSLLPLELKQILAQKTQEL